MGRIRGQVSLTPGDEVVYEGVPHVIVRLVDMTTLVARALDSTELVLLPVADLQAPESNLSTDLQDLVSVNESAWKKAQWRWEIISSLVSNEARTRADVEAVASAKGVSVATIYRWIDRYERVGLRVALVNRAAGPRSRSRLHPQTEEAIEWAVERLYLTKSDASFGHLFETIQQKCKALEAPVPHPNSVRNRLKRLAARVVTKKREGSKAAERFNPAASRYDVKLPFNVFQIDHTLADIMVVDEEHRLPIGRPWLTLVIDVHSRVIPGFYLSLDAPSAESVGMALVHAVCPKDKWLAARNIAVNWPIWGIPNTVHADNGSDFRCEAVNQACQNHGIDIQWRPVAKPKFGGHIERLIGTFMRDLRALPGWTGANISQKGERKPEKEATFTLSELECWFATKIAGVYHERKHSSLGMAPMRKFELGVYGDGQNNLGVGLPASVPNERQLFIDFLPMHRVSVQQYGIVIDRVYYYDDCLRRWIGERNHQNPSQPRKFIVRRSRRRISPVYFFDPEQEEYIEIHYADLSLPVISKGELDAARKLLKAQGHGNIDEQALFKAAEELRALEQAANSKTVSARRSTQKRKSRNAEIQGTPVETRPPVAHSSDPPPRPPVVDEDDAETLEPFYTEEPDV